jgi:hypothetical protein
MSTGNSGPGTNGDNVVHGCSNFAPTTSSGCAPLNGKLHDDDCAANPPWQCDGGVRNLTEITIVTKPSSALGGVLCCRD